MSSAENWSRSRTEFLWRLGLQLRAGLKDPGLPESFWFMVPLRPNCRTVNIKWMVAAGDLGLICFKFQQCCQAGIQSKYDPTSAGRCVL